MKLKKIESPWELSIEELQKRCVVIEAADGQRCKPEFCYDAGNPSVIVVPPKGPRLEVRAYGWHLLGWTFYEEAKPLVWEGECVIGSYGYVFHPEGGLLSFPSALKHKRFKVTITEIVEGEDA